MWYTVPVLNMQATANWVFQTAYHVVWIPKYRRPILTAGNVSAHTIRRYIERAAHVSSRR